jgi:hypothetical protein
MRFKKKVFTEFDYLVICGNVYDFSDFLPLRYTEYNSTLLI